MPPNTKLHPAAQITLTRSGVTIAVSIHLTTLDLPTQHDLDTATNVNYDQGEGVVSNYALMRVLLSQSNVLGH